MVGKAQVRDAVSLRTTYGARELNRVLKGHKGRNTRSENCRVITKTKSKGLEESSTFFMIGCIKEMTEVLSSSGK